VTETNDAAGLSSRARDKEREREREREREGEDGTRVSASESGAPFHRPAERDGRWERSAVDAAIGRASERERERERERGRKKKETRGAPAA